MTEPFTISPRELMDQLGTPNAPVLIDVSIDQDIAADPYVIPTARRWPYTDVASLAKDLKDRDVVTICQKGRKLSQGAAALLRTQGIFARALAGGNIGWKNTGYPRIALHNLPPNSAGSRWVCEHGPEPSTLATAWFIRRFVDPRSVFLFVERDEVSSVAEKYGASPLQGATIADISDVLGFEASVMTRFAQTVSAVRGNGFELKSEAHGLSAILYGLSHSLQTDLELLEATMTFFDALYRWTRDQDTEKRPLNEAAT